MKYLVTCLMVLPVMTACTVIQEDYYQPDYYRPAPQVEVRRYHPPVHYHNENRRYHGHNEYRPAPQGGSYHGHSSVGSAPQVQGNVHGHDESNQQIKPIARIQSSSTESAVKIENHTQVNTQTNTHGHS
ncbi:MAG TPA: hypothetical protein PK657_13125 [Legionella sp.]|nr:hypothetical protein [Legionella sp.]